MTIVIPVDTTAIVNGENIDAEDVTTPINDLKVAVEDTLNGEQPFEQLSLGSTTEVTISSGGITINRSRHRVDTEANSTSDFLDSILGGSDGDLLRLQLESASRQVVIRHNGSGTGNIRTVDGLDISLANEQSYVDLIYDLAMGIWMVIAPTSAPTIRELNDPTLTSYKSLVMPDGALITNGIGADTQQPFLAFMPAPYRRHQRWIHSDGSGITSVGIGSITNSTPLTQSFEVEGTFTNFATGSSIFQNAYMVVSNLCQFRHDPMFACRIKVIDTADIELVIGFFFNLSASDRLWFRATSGFWNILAQSGSSTGLNTGIAVTANTVYELTAWIDSTNSIAYFSINGSTPLTINTDVPVNTTAVNFQLFLQNNVAAVKNLRFSRVYLTHK